MIKKILFIQIISLMLCSCSSFPLEGKVDSLSMTEMRLIKNQIADKWIPIVGDLEKVTIKTSLELEIDGTVTKAEIKSITCPPEAEQICKLIAESAKKAIKNASPIKNLRPDRYNVWKKIDLDFYPGNYRSQ